MVESLRWFSSALLPRDFLRLLFNLFPPTLSKTQDNNSLVHVGFVEPLKQFMVFAYPLFEFFVNSDVVGFSIPPRYFE